jgi:hypothetical protein
VLQKENLQPHFFSTYLILILHPIYFRIILPPPLCRPTQSGPLLTVTLETLLRYLSWIPIGYVLETSVIEILVLKFFPFALFQNIALQVCVSAAMNANSIFARLFKYISV